MPFVARPISDRLATGIVRDPETGCHNWTRSLFNDGYGCIQADGGKRSLRTHRVAYELTKGEIPPGLVIDHLCKNILCCNPDHLEAVTVRVNIIRGDGMGAKNMRKNHCVHGHEFTPENTYWRPSGGRRCRSCCRTLALAAYHARTKSNLGDPR